MAATSPLDIYKMLPKTNCGRCGQATCLAFAAAVIKKHEQLSLCPYLHSKIIEQLGARVTTQMTAEETRQKMLDDLKRQLPEVDLESRADALGGRMNGGELIIKCLGKDFSVNAQGCISSDCHTHAWFSIPFLTYILLGQGKEASGKWVTFRNLKDGINWDAFFEQQCTLKLKKLADSHNELFGDLISLFGATTTENHLEADISVVLHPLPKVPMMVCYWRPGNDLPSDLRVFFDSTADQNLSTQSVFGLGTGIAMMLKKIMERHI
ncbi:MAG: DUF3786 domain-containing protein [Actinomycetota bacterium]|jgi:hypothetical protein|nr:DUF3786 domain-containing protein [Actinomycetota bacterium]MCL6092812.1 DUF3786 domain-containing protein [Actinomycetota bacterium]MDA8166214.1 DUF3786 domain-containing protein [Actinomycetota bacterium]